MKVEHKWELHRLDASLSEFTAAGLLLETDPDTARLRLQDEILLAISHIGLPEKYNPWHRYLHELPIDSDNFVDYLVLVEYLSRFDASSMMAMPGTSLACRAVLTLGNEQQQALFFSRYLQCPTWTFFAVSEPEVGSDASAIRTQLTPHGDRYLLNGEKMFIGGAQLASIGLVFASQGQGRTQLVMVEPHAAPQAFNVDALEAYGLAGAGLTRITITDFPVAQEQILGRELSGLHQGINALGTVFEKHRPLVAAMALGTARGLLDALDAEGIDDLASYWRCYRALYYRLLALGDEYQQGRSKVWLTSQLKMQATAFVEQVAMLLPQRLPAVRWLNMPALQKRYRDAFAFEYMEGTSHIHRLNAFRAYVSSRGVR
ncbi:acyl-CoA dehydrogenase family protein [Pectobacteriaceae bacterium CE90]|nr:acyl-CoA dehydrogenase family protein [Prodigiosinella sp. LS101]WJV55460.1 acyl-CoA dehydrogenase family protein [Prodigiosinella sp. LS101]WJV59821.1 acyl-CoA dehydrogenase family protein [Pectobacteriaceae bacterium C111]WJY13484.1 acyl-CoA dehydrogenase family protein [Pectobacteriaceae bacterium CE90]